MALYQINQSIYPAAVEQDWQGSLQAGDAVLLIEAGVLRVSQHAPDLARLQERNIQIFLRESDVLAYGISPTIGHLISDDEWVTQTTIHDTIISW